jgi:hypothetical protein
VEPSEWSALKARQRSAKSFGRENLARTTLSNTAALPHSSQAQPNGVVPLGTHENPWLWVQREAGASSMQLDLDGKWNDSRDVA